MSSSSSSDEIDLKNDDNTVVVDNNKKKENDDDIKPPSKIYNVVGNGNDDINSEILPSDHKLDDDSDSDSDTEETILPDSKDFLENKNDYLVSAYSSESTNSGNKSIFSCLDGNGARPGVSEDSSSCEIL